jgi:peptide/nickel transport system permease protein
MSLSGEIELVTEPGGSAELDTGTGEKGIQGRSLGAIALRRLRQDKVAMAGGIVVIIIGLVAIFASQLNDLIGQQPNEFHTELTYSDTQFPIGAWGGMSSTHLLGVQPVFGQDILAKIIAGARTSLIVGLLATALSLVLGISIGLIAGYYRGVTDTILSRVMDTLLSFPVLLFSIALLAVFNQVPHFAGLSGQSLRFAVIIFVLGFFSWPYVARIIRGQVLSLREKEFVDAARSLGATDFRIITREILPNLVGPILVYTTLAIPTNILGEAGLSFLGVGLVPPTSSWGQMLNTAAPSVQIDPSFLFWPGLALFITVLSFNLFGDGLRDALDPKSTR